MEKLIYPVWKKSEQSELAFRDELLGRVSEKLIDAGVLKLKVCIVDSDVQAAAKYRIEAHKPLMDAMLSIWVNSAIYREPLELIVGECSARFAGYLVTESEPLVNSKYSVPVGDRTPGMNQVVFLTKPERLSYQEWLQIWHYSHTDVAIETQSTFGYRQNVIVRSLTDSSAHFDAIVEENFPAAAIADRMAFYDAGNDQGLYKEREGLMIESCAKFIDFDQIDCIPTSEYIMKE